MVTLDFLKKVRIFEGLDNNQLSLIMDGCREKEYKKEELLFREQEEARELWVVLEGQVDIRFDLPGRATSKESTVYSETAGASFGWSSFVPPYKYILSAYCAGPICRIVQLEKEYLLKLFKSDPEMGYKVMTNLAGVISIRFHNMQKTSIGMI